MNRPLRILIVEDCPTVAEAVTIMLQSAGIQTALVNDLAGALVRLQEGGFQGVVLDLGLPDTEEVGAVSTLRKTFPGLPIVVLTGSGEEMVGPALLAGADDFLTKGEISARLLVSTLRKSVVRREELHKFFKAEQSLASTDEALRQAESFKAAVDAAGILQENKS